MPGGVGPGAVTGTPGVGALVIIGLDGVMPAAPTGGAVERDAPTAISQRCPGCPCAGLGSTTAVLVGGTICTGAVFGLLTVEEGVGATVTSASCSPPQAANRRAKARPAIWILRQKCMDRVVSLDQEEVRFNVGNGILATGALRSH